MLGGPGEELGSCLGSCVPPHDFPQTSHPLTEIPTCLQTFLAQSINLGSFVWNTGYMHTKSNSPTHLPIRVLAGLRWYGIILVSAYDDLPRLSLTILALMVYRG